MISQPKSELKLITLVNGVRVLTRVHTIISLRAHSGSLHTTARTVFDIFSLEIESYISIHKYSTRIRFVSDLIVKEISGNEKLWNGESY